MKHEVVTVVKYTEDYILLSDGKEIRPPHGQKFDLDVIKKIWEVND